VIDLVQLCTQFEEARATLAEALGSVPPDPVESLLRAIISEAGFEMDGKRYLVCDRDKVMSQFYDMEQRL
jgi:hypothetical protein